MRIYKASGWLAAGLALLSWQPAGAVPFKNELLRSVVKIHVTQQRPDYGQPWQAGAASSGSGSGFVVAGRRLLTNAHVVSDAKFIEVQRHGESRKYPARILFVGHDCDLAILSVDDEGFFEGLEPLPFGSGVPDLGQEVHAVGFPMGGAMLSLTRGVVSRIDINRYAHSFVDAHLVMQIDAAINPGNSGGPVVLDGKVVGVAFQGVSAGQNLGYAIPLPVVEHFLKDVEDGRYDGYPELGVVTLDARNPALRAGLGLKDAERGTLITHVDPFGAGAGRLLPGDVLLAMDGYAVAPDGSVHLPHGNLHFGELVERRQAGEKLTFEVWRSNAVAQVEVKLDSPVDPFIFRQEYDLLPEYVLAGGLLFTPMTRGFLSTLGEGDDRALLPLFYYAGRAKMDNLVADRKQFVVLAGRLPLVFNSYAQGFQNRIVTEVNGRKVRELADIPDGLAQPTNGFHVIRFENEPLPLVLDAAATAAADMQTLARYRVPALRRLRAEEVP